MMKLGCFHSAGLVLLLVGCALNGSTAVAADPAVLIAGMKSPRRLERVSSAWELGEMREATAGAALVAALEDEDAGVRLWAARSLVKIGAPAVEPLLTVLVRSDAKEGLASDYVIPVLGEIKAPRALPALVLVVLRCGDTDFKSHQECRSAMKALSGFGGQAFDPLVAGLREIEHPQTRYFRPDGLFEALGNTNDPRAVDAILGAVAKGYHPPPATDPAARALGKLRDPRALDYLVKRLLEGQGWPDTDAAWALGEIGDARAVEPLIVASTRIGPGTGIWDRVIVPLGKTRDPRAVAALHGMMGQAGSGMIPFALAAAGPATLQAAPGALQSPDANVRRGMAAALGEMTDPTTVPLLITVLGDAVVDVRAVAYQGLQSKGLKDRSIADLLVMALRRPEPELRLSSSKLLLMLTPSQVTPDLLASLKDDNAEVRKHILGVLSRLTLKDAGYAKHFVSALQDPDPEVRRWASLYLGGRNDMETIEPLILRLKDEGPGVRAMAARSLGMIGDIKARDPLFALLQDADREVSGQALLALAALKDQRVIAPLFSAIEKGYPSRKSEEAADALVAFGPSGLEYALSRMEGGGPATSKAILKIMNKTREPRYLRPLLPLLKDEDPEIRANAALAIGHLGQDAVEPLLAVLADPNRMVRIFVMRALGQTGDSRAVTPLVTALRESGKDLEIQGAAAESLSKIEGFEPTREMLLDPNPAVQGVAFAYQRRLALRGGSEAPDASFVQLLISRLEDPNVGVQRNAAETLKAIGPPIFRPWMVPVRTSELPWPEYVRSPQ